MEKNLLRNIQQLWHGTLKIPAVILLWIFIGYQSFHISSQYGGTDLRARVVGARLLFTEHSPYTYTWQPGDPQQLLDPNVQPGRKVNGNVVTPAVLWLMQPLALLPYQSIRLIWTGLELLAAFLILYWLAGKKSPGQLAGFFFLPSLLFVAGPYWNFHADRGQMYIFYTALMALSWFLYTKGYRGKFWSGVVAGLLVFLRPFAICFALPFLAAQKKGWIKGFATGILAGALLWILPMQQTWKDYAAAMKMYSAEITGTVVKDNSPVPKFPAKVEAMENLRTYVEYPINAFPTLHEISEKWGLRFPQWAAYGLLVLFMVVLTAEVIRNKIVAPEKLFMCGFILMLACEYTTHAPRAPYNLLMWLAPVCLWLASNRFQQSKTTWIIVGILFLCLHPAFTFGKSFGYVGEAVMFGVGMVYILGRQQGLKASFEKVKGFKG